MSGPVPEFYHATATLQCKPCWFWRIYEADDRAEDPWPQEMLEACAVHGDEMRVFLTSRCLHCDFNHTFPVVIGAGGIPIIDADILSGHVERVHPRKAHAWIRKMERYAAACQHA